MVPLALAIAMQLLATSAAPAADDDGPVSSIRVRVARGAVTVDVRDAPLAEVLRTIGQHADVDVTVRGALDAKVTRSFVASSLEDAVRRLARGHSTVWIYEPSRSATDERRPAELLIVATPASTPGAVIRPDERAARLRAVRGLLHRRDAAALSELARLAEDSDAIVRLHALRVLTRIHGDGATPALAAALERDADPMVRRAAAQLLGTSRGAAARATLERAAHDPDLSVRRAVAAALTAWQRRAR